MKQENSLNMLRAGRRFFGSCLVFCQIFVSILAVASSGAVAAAPAEDTSRRLDAVPEAVTSRYSKFEDLGVDLVVSKVKFTRGTFGGESKIQVVPYIKNMCNGRVSARFDISVPFIIKLWTTGIGPKQEKAVGAFYYQATGSPEASVAVDADDVVKENNEDNNICANAKVSFAASETGSKTYNCPIVNPRCRHRPPFEKERERRMPGR